jgi:toxin YoeB
VNLLWTPQAWDDYVYWQANDRKMLAAINTLIADIRRDPFKGLGKPEPLKHALQGYWSRRIDHEHRLVYRVIGAAAAQQIQIIQCRYHY